jgi:hypothetical protein
MAASSSPPLVGPRIIAKQKLRRYALEDERGSQKGSGGRGAIRSHDHAGHAMVDDVRCVERCSISYRFSSACAPSFGVLVSPRLPHPTTLPLGPSPCNCPGGSSSIRLTCYRRGASSDSSNAISVPSAWIRQGLIHLLPQKPAKLIIV